MASLNVSAAAIGTTPSKIDRIASPIMPPRPVASVPASIGAWADANTAPMTMAMGAMISRDQMRWSPECEISRSAQTSSQTGRPQDARPSVRMNGSAINAPAAPSMLVARSGVALNQLGSAGLYVPKMTTKTRPISAKPRPTSSAPRRVRNSCAEGGNSGVFCFSVQLVISDPQLRRGSRSGRGAHCRACRQAPP